MNSMKQRLGTPSGIPHWHFTMLRDTERNGGIESSIANLDLTGKTVVEIGTGIGLPAMLFAKYGAAHVYTCEMDVNLAAIAREVVRENGYDKRITVIPKTSRAAIRDGDLRREPDIIFTETLDCGVVGEGFATIAEDVRQLAGTNTQVLPDHVRQFGYLCCDTAAHEKNTVKSENGLDLSGINCFSKQTYFAINPALHSPARLSPVFRVRDYDYRNADCLVDRTIALIATQSGTCHGMISYFDATFGDFLISTVSEKSHWAQAFHPLKRPVSLTAGSRYVARITAAGTLRLDETI
ncbi:hypothetical protein [uncultured Tateyamaria sp.]|uniref:hypothetical protein n=1 Tax=uncultured Tateyamaria sp. TaxID=455651 RepID=UPI00262ACACA|nr:hypothetical protein [uncultured Tateyamaria sp.]